MSKLITVRKATLDDVEAVYMLLRDFFEWSGIPNDLLDLTTAAKTINYYITHPNAATFLAEADGQAVGVVPVGLVPAIFNANINVVIEVGWWIKEDFRYSSVIKQLIGAIKNWAKNKKAIWIHMHITTDRVHFSKMEGLCHQSAA